MGDIRRSRTERPEKSSIRLSDNDRELLHAVGRMKFAKTTHLALTHFADRSACSRRLAQLVAAQLLNVFVLDLNSENIYGLTERGRALLIADGAAPDDLHLGERVQRPGLPHVLLTNDLRVELVLACRRDETTSIDFFRADADLRRLAGAHRAVYVPDALARLATPRGLIGIVVEIDTAAESARYFANHKGRPLAALWRARRPVWGLFPWRPIVIAPSAEYLRVLARALRGGAPWLGSTIDVIKTAGAFGPAFAALSDLDRLPPGASPTWSRSLLEPPEAP